jgi:hypothetical protein
MGKVTTQTWTVYRQALLGFVVWCASIQRCAADLDEIDELLAEWAELCRPRKQQFVMTVSCIELVLPDCKGNLPWAHAIIAGTAISNPSLHRVPMPEAAMLVLAADLWQCGDRRMAAGLYLQWSKGMRPSEMLKVEHEHVTLPSSSTFVGSQHAIVTLGARTGTKLKRPQAVIFRAQVDQFAIAFLTWLMATAQPGGCLVGLTYGQYAYRLQKACRKLGLPRYTPHSPRAGWATHQVLLGRDFVSIREEGRWTVDASLRVYLDVLSSASQQNAPALGQFLERATCIKQNMEAFFPLGNSTEEKSIGTRVGVTRRGQ